MARRELPRPAEGVTFEYGPIWISPRLSRWQRARVWLWSRWLLWRADRMRDE